MNIILMYLDERNKRLGKIWSAAREVYSTDPSKLPKLDSLIVPNNEEERTLLQRMGFVLRAKAAYDHGFNHSDPTYFEDWMSSLEGSEREAAQIIYEYAREKDRSPSTMLFGLHSVAQEELVQKISGVYPSTPRQ